jgi:hypothetical protein
MEHDAKESCSPLRLTGEPAGLFCLTRPFRILLLETRELYSFNDPFADLF